MCPGLTLAADWAAGRGEGCDGSHDEGGDAAARQNGPRTETRSARTSGSDDPPTDSASHTPPTAVAAIPPASQSHIAVVNVWRSEQRPSSIARQSPSATTPYP